MLSVKQSDAESEHRDATPIIPNEPIRFVPSRRPEFGQRPSSNSNSTGRPPKLDKHVTNTPAQRSAPAPLLARMPGVRRIHGQNALVPRPRTERRRCCDDAAATLRRNVGVGAEDDF